MSGTGHIKQYSAADIRRYLEGKMPPAEMHALEKAALDDPFLADAIEGMQQTEPQQDSSRVEADLDELRQKIAERTRKQSPRQARVVAFRWWQVAAAAVIVVIGGIWAFNYFGSNDKVTASEHLATVTQQTSPERVVPPAPPASAPDAAMAKPAEPESAAAGKLAESTKETYSSATTPANSVSRPEQPVSPQVHKSTQAKDPAATEPAAVHDNLPANRQRSLAAPTLPAAKQFLAEVKTDSIKDLVKTGKISDNNNLDKVYYNSLEKTYKSKPSEYEQIVIAKTARDTQARSFYTRPRELAMNTSRKELSERQAKKNPNALLSGFISGRVTDQSNNPLSNALLRVDGRQDFFTDQRGQFKIPVKDSVVNVAVGFSGYYTQNLKLQNNTDNNISLNQLGVKAPNPQLNDSFQGITPGITVADKAKNVAPARTNVPEVMVQDAQPEYGWLEYQQYLEKNKRIPAGTPALRGSVVVSFEVDKKGILSNFNIEQSLGKAYDEEAIRLIKAGPSWKLIKGHKAKATVVVRF